MVDGSVLVSKMRKLLDDDQRGRSLVEEPVDILAGLEPH